MLEETDEIIDDDVLEDTARLDGDTEATTDATELEDIRELEDFIRLEALEFAEAEFVLDAPPPQATNTLEHSIKNIARIIISTSTLIQCIKTLDANIAPIVGQLL